MAGGLLPAGYLSTDGNQIVDSAGQDVRIASVGWNAAGAGTDFAAGFAQIAAEGFNCVRIDWQDATLQANLPWYRQLVQAAAAVGIKVIFDHHADETPGPGNGWLAQQGNGLPFDLGPGTDGTDGSGDTGTVTVQQFVQDTQTLAQAFAGNSTVIGFDLDNEPLENPGQATWGTGGPTDLQQIYEQAGDAVQALDPGALIICEGPISFNGTNGVTGDFDLTQAASHPVSLTIPGKVVYSVHAYPSSIGGQAVDSGPALVQAFNHDWGYLVTQNIAPVWIGEMGASLDGTADSANGNLADEQAWAATMIAYLNGQDGPLGGPSFTGSQQGISTDWWTFGSLPGEYPDGTQNADGSPDAAQAAIYQQLQYDPAPPPNNSVLLAGSASALTDAGGNVWTIVNGVVQENGAAAGYNANVSEIAYVGGVVWQENASNLWWSWTGTAWSAGNGTAISPIPPASPEDTVVMAGSGQAITDAAGNTWTIADGVAQENGAAAGYSGNVSELAYVGGAVWQENASNLWWNWTGTAWSAGNGTGTSPLPPAPSPDDTVVIAGSGQAITDAAGNTWTIAGGVAQENGAAAGYSGNVSELAYVGGVVWQENAAGLWWGWTGTAWSAGNGTSTSPLPVPDTISVTAGGVNQTAVPTASGSTVGGDTFRLLPNGVTQAMLGTGATLARFTGSAGVELTGGAAGAIIVATGGDNSFSAGSGAMDITGGPGANAYVFNADSTFLRIEDFSAAKGDTLTIAASLQGVTTAASDGMGGTIISFGAASNGMISLPQVDVAPTIRFA